MVLCAGDSESFPFAVPIGIGLVHSAINLTRLATMEAPEFLLFVGTAGSYGEHEIFEIVESKTAANVEQALLTGSAYTPISNVVSAAEDVSRETIVNSSNYITTDREIAKKFLEKNLKLENMEFFSVLAVAKTFGIPAGGVFCVTNYCDENAHRDFLANQKEAMERLENYLREKGVLKRQLLVHWDVVFLLPNTPITNIPIHQYTRTIMKKIIQDYTKEELAQRIQPSIRAKQIYNWVYHRHADSFHEMENLPKSLRAELEEEYTLHPLKMVSKQESRDGSVKYLFKLHDGHTVEAVLLLMKEAQYHEDGSLKHHRRYTVCISSQVGCKVGCAF